jgi:hypothetical protein
VQETARTFDGPRVRGDRTLDKTDRMHDVEKPLLSPSRSTKTVAGSLPSPSRGPPRFRRFEPDEQADYVPWEPENVAPPHPVEVEPQEAEVPTRRSQLICASIREGAW